MNPNRHQRTIGASTRTSSSAVDRTGRANDACRDMYWRSAWRNPHGPSIDGWTTGHNPRHVFEGTRRSPVAPRSPPDSAWRTTCVEAPCYDQQHSGGVTAPRFVGAIVVTPGVETCSTNSRIDDVQADIARVVSPPTDSAIVLSRNLTSRCLAKTNVHSRTHDGDPEAVAPKRRCPTN